MVVVGCRVSERLSPVAQTKLGMSAMRAGLAILAGMIRP
jgi:hypothetical protein